MRDSISDESPHVYKAAGLCKNTLEAPTTTTSSAAISTSSDGRPQLLVSRHNRLQVWECTDGETTLTHDLNLFQGVEHVLAVTHPATKEQIVLLATQSDTLCAVRWTGDAIDKIGAEELSLGLQDNQILRHLRRPEKMSVSQAITLANQLTVLAMALHESVIHIVSMTWHRNGKVDLTLNVLEADLRGTPGRGDSSLKDKLVTCLFCFFHVPCPAPSHIGSKTNMM
jgi:hypothetical protein